MFASRFIAQKFRTGLVNVSTRSMALGMMKRTTLGAVCKQPYTLSLGGIFRRNFCNKYVDFSKNAEPATSDGHKENSQSDNVPLQEEQIQYEAATAQRPQLTDDEFLEINSLRLLVNESIIKSEFDFAQKLLWKYKEIVEKCFAVEDLEYIWYNYEQAYVWLHTGKEEEAHSLA